MTPIEFRSSVVAAKDGEYVVALFGPLPPPLQGLETCVALLQCSRETLQALCDEFPRDFSGLPE